MLKFTDKRNHTIFSKTSVHCFFTMHYSLHPWAHFYGSLVLLPLSPPQLSTGSSSFLVIPPPPPPKSLFKNLICMLSSNCLKVFFYFFSPLFFNFFPELQSYKFCFPNCRIIAAVVQKSI